MSNILFFMDVKRLATAGSHCLNEYWDFRFLELTGMLDNIMLSFF